MASSIFNKVAEAQALNNSTYFTEGHYIVDIQDAFVKENRLGLQIAIIECRTVQCTNPTVRIGSNVSWICKLQGSDIGPRDLKTQFCGIVNCRPNQVTPDLLETSFTPDPETGVSPLAGRRCYVYAYPVNTEKGGTFTKVEFRGIDENNPAPDLSAIKAPVAQSSQVDADLVANGGNIPF
jgi:hypothetical protein